MRARGGWLGIVCALGASILTSDAGATARAFPGVITTNLALDASGTSLFAAALDHPGSDSFWSKSRPPALFRYRDRGGSAGGLTQVVLKHNGSRYGMKAKGKSAGLASLQGGALSAALVVGDQCYAATVPCQKKGRALRCAP